MEVQVWRGHLGTSALSDLLSILLSPSRSAILNFFDRHFHPVDSVPNHCSYRRSYIRWMTCTSKAVWLIALAMPKCGALEAAIGESS